MKNKYADFVVKVAQTMLEMLTVFFAVVAFIAVFAIPVGVVISLFCHIPWWVKILIVVFGFVFEAVCITYLNSETDSESSEECKNEQKESDSEK